MAAALRTVDVIRVPTAEGVKEIQLLFGDITALPLSEKVDMIMVSAFHGDYAPISGTVIGALRGIGLSVRELAHNRAEDLRKMCYCWWSHQLPAKFPYRRLLCFETSGSGQVPHAVVGEVFRALISASFLFQENGGSVISPLLSSGNQGFGSMAMLSALVDGSARWMQCGLNVSTFKIVVYTPSQKLEQLFSTLKQKWETIVVAVPSHPVAGRKEGDTDCYLCYHQDDAEQVNDIIAAVHREVPALKMVKNSAINTDVEDWMQPMSEKLRTYQRVLVFLSPAFVDDKTCVEIYNLTLCISRLMGRGFLWPFYIATVAHLPTYMTMVQWTDARILSDGSTEKRTRNIAVFIKGLSSADLHDPATINAHSKAAPRVVEKKPLSYNVFISYCHKDAASAELILHTLQRLNPSLTVFFDKKELSTGSSWQLELYGALQHAQIVVALLSSSYAQSAMCQEELALSVMRYNAPGSAMHLVPLLLEDAADDDVVASGYAGNSVNAYKATDGLGVIIAKLCKAVDMFATYGIIVDKFFHRSQAPLDFLSIMSSYRLILSEEVQKELCLRGNSTTAEAAAAPDHRLSAGRVLIISCAADASVESALSDMLERRAERSRQPLVVLPSRRGEGQQLPRYNLLDDADIIVAVVSPDIVRSQEDYEELQVALSRQRKSHGRRLLYPLLSKDLDGSSPLYLHTLCYTACLSDSQWSCQKLPPSTDGTAGGGENPLRSSAVESCVNFCCDIIELVINKESAIAAIPGCNGSVLLNIAAVKRWLDKKAEDGRHQDSSLAMTFREAEQGFGSLHAIARPAQGTYESSNDSHDIAVVSVYEATDRKRATKATGEGTTGDHDYFKGEDDRAAAQTMLDVGYMKPAAAGLSQESADKTREQLHHEPRVPGKAASRDEHGEHPSENEDDMASKSPVCLLL